MSSRIVLSSSSPYPIGVCPCFHSSSSTKSNSLHKLMGVEASLVPFLYFQFVSAADMNNKDWWLIVGGEESSSMSCL